MGVSAASVRVFQTAPESRAKARADQTVPPGRLVFFVLMWEQEVATYRS